MPPVKPLLDKTYGRLTVLERVQNDRHGNAVWLCLCECGEVKAIVGAALRNGATKSCGCALYLPDYDTTTTAQQRWNARNPEKTRAARRRWYARNREAGRARAAAYKKSHRSEYTQRQLARVRKAPLLTQNALAAVYDYYGRNCVYCGASATGVDHLHPVSRGGTNGLYNLAPCCRACNSRKYNLPIWVMLETA